MTDLLTRPQESNMFNEEQIRANNLPTTEDAANERNYTRADLNVPHILVIPSDGTRLSVIDALEGTYSPEEEEEEVEAATAKRKTTLSRSKRINLIAEMEDVDGTPTKTMETIVTEASLKSVLHDCVSLRPDRLIVSVDIERDGVKGAAQHLVDCLDLYAAEMRVIQRPRGDNNLVSMSRMSTKSFFSGKCRRATLSLDGTLYFLPGGSSGPAVDTTFHSHQCMTKCGEMFQFRVKAGPGKIRVGLRNAKPDDDDDLMDEAGARVLDCEEGDVVSVGIQVS